MATSTIWPWFLMLHQALPPPRWTNLSFIWLMCLLTVHVHRMGTWNVPIRPLLMELWGGTFVDFWVVFALGDTWHILARWKLGKKTHPNNGGRHCPKAAMVPSPQHGCIQQLANILHDKSMLLKLEDIIVSTFYTLAILRHDASLMCRA